MKTTVLAIPLITRPEHFGHLDQPEGTLIGQIRLKIRSGRIELLCVLGQRQTYGRKDVRQIAKNDPLPIFFLLTEKLRSAKLKSVCIDACTLITNSFHLTTML